MRARQKGLELACDIPHDVPDMLVGDAGRLRQIIVNSGARKRPHSTGKMTKGNRADSGRQTFANTVPANAASVSSITAETTNLVRYTRRRSAGCERSIGSVRYVYSCPTDCAPIASDPAT